MCAGVVEHFAEAAGIERSHQAQSLQVAGAGRFNMNPTIGKPRDDRIDAELVRASMDAELVVVEVLHDRDVPGQLRLELADVAHVVDTFLELAHETWR